MEIDPVTLKDLLDERQRAHEEIHRSEWIVHERELKLSDAKFVSVNEVREQIASERGLFATREHMNTELGAVCKRVENLERTIANLEGRMLGVGAVVAFISIAVSVGSHFIK